MSLTKRWSEADCLSRIVLAHASRQATVSLIFDVRHKTMKNPIWWPIAVILIAGFYALLPKPFISIVVAGLGVLAAHRLQEWANEDRKETVKYAEAFPIGMSVVFSAGIVCLILIRLA